MLLIPSCQGVFHRVGDFRGGLVFLKRDLSQLKNKKAEIIEGSGVCPGWKFIASTWPNRGGVLDKNANSIFCKGQFTKFDRYQTHDFNLSY